MHYKLSFNIKIPDMFRRALYAILRGCLQNHVYCLVSRHFLCVVLILRSFRCFVVLLHGIHGFKVTISYFTRKTNDCIFNCLLTTPTYFGCLLRTSSGSTVSKSKIKTCVANHFRIWVYKMLKAAISAFVVLFS